MLECLVKYVESTAGKKAIIWPNTFDANMHINKPNISGNAFFPNFSIDDKIQKNIAIGSMNIIISFINVLNENIYDFNIIGAKYSIIISIIIENNSRNFALYC